MGPYHRSFTRTSRTSRRSYLNGGYQLLCLDLDVLMLSDIVTNSLRVVEVDLAGLLDVQLLGGDKENTVADEEEKDDRFEVYVG